MLYYNTHLNFMKELNVPGKFVNPDKRTIIDDIFDRKYNYDMNHHMVKSFDMMSIDDIMFIETLHNAIQYLHGDEYVTKRNYGDMNMHYLSKEERIAITIGSMMKELSSFPIYSDECDDETKRENKRFARSHLYKDCIVFDEEKFAPCMEDMIPSSYDLYVIDDKDYCYNDLKYNTIDNIVRFLINASGIDGSCGLPYDFQSTDEAEKYLHNLIENVNHLYDGSPENIITLFNKEYVHQDVIDELSEIFSSGLSLYQRRSFKPIANNSKKLNGYRVFKEVSQIRSSCIIEADSKLYNNLALLMLYFKALDIVDGH